MNDYSSHLRPTGFSSSDLLHIVDPLTGETVDHYAITLAGVTVLGGYGIARDPNDGKIYAVLDVAGQRQLVTINPGTGIATHIGGLGRKFAGLAFNSSGTLYGVTDDDASIPESLFVIDKQTAGSTFVMGLGNGNDGEAIAFNPNDGLFYHASGNDTTGTPPLAEVFESVNQSTAAVTNIALSGDYTPFTNNYLQVASLTHSTGNLLLLADGTANKSGPGSRLYSITTNGVVTLLGPMTHTATGMVFVPKAPNDFDRDGKSDILWRNTSGALYEWRLDGSTKVGEGSVGAVGTDWTVAGIGDFNGDGSGDILWRHSSGNSYIWILDGTSVIGNGSPGAVSTNWTIAGVGDFNGDGKSAILWRHTSGSTYIWLLDGTSIIAHGSPGPASTDWNIARVGDFNGDGKSDILWHHTSGGTYIWLLNGTSVIADGSPGSLSTDWQIQ